MPAGQVKKELIAVYQVADGEARRPFSYGDDPIEYLPPEAPLPRMGEVLLLSTAAVGGEPSSAWGGALAPFEVVEVEHVYRRPAGQHVDRLHPKAARYVRIVINVRRLSDAEYNARPGGAGR